VVHRPTNKAPKPNIRFLRNIIRETEGHNATLLAKEAEESKAKLKELRTGDNRRKREESPQRSRKRRRSIDNYVESRGNGTRESREKDREYSRKHRTRDRSKDRRGSYRRRDASSESERNHRSRRRRRSHERSRSQESDYERKHRSRRKSHRHHDRSRSRSTPEDSRKSHRKHLRRKASPSDEEGNSKKPSILPVDGSAKTKADSVDSDSDPLERLVGPLPPSRQSEKIVKRRGRGAFSSSGDHSMNAHFAADYDPSTDVRPDSDHDDDWEEALEAMRDRQRWKQQGADRLRQAGFTDAQITKWENGDEKNEEDIRWAKKGEGREWDRGKVLDDEGNIDLKPEWGRLKGT
jgi:hypothetical protein